MSFKNKLSEVIACSQHIASIRECTALLEKTFETFSAVNAQNASVFPVAVNEDILKTYGCVGANIDCIEGHLETLLELEAEKELVTAIDKGMQQAVAEFNKLFAKVRLVTLERMNHPTVDHAIINQQMAFN